jgi:hypothetical protein
MTSRAAESTVPLITIERQSPRFGWCSEDVVSGAHEDCGSGTQLVRFRVR